MLILLVNHKFLGQEGIDVYSGLSYSLGKKYYNFLGKNSRRSVNKVDLEDQDEIWEDLKNKSWR